MTANALYKVYKYSKRNFKSFSSLWDSTFSIGIEVEVSFPFYNHFPSDLKSRFLSLGELQNCPPLSFHVLLSQQNRLTINYLVMFHPKLKDTQADLSVPC